MELIGHGHSCIEIRLNDGTNLYLILLLMATL